MREMYIDKYGDKRFTPKAVQDAIEEAHRASLRGPSLIQDKVATPAEPAGNLQELERTLRPMHAAESWNKPYPQYITHRECCWLVNDVARCPPANHGR